MRLLVLALTLTACSTPAKQPVPEPPPSSPPAVAIDAAALAQRADGERCTTGTDCVSGVCEGQGCGDAQPGTCAPAQRACTKDLRPYCGCDGTTFHASGSCPGRRYQAEGECPTATPTPPPLRADGESCFEANQCASGVCEGQGCGELQPGTCAPAQRACTRDLRPYCGCDGKTFRTSGSCPGRRYHAKGECPTAAKNRPAGALCLTAGQCASGICEGKGCSDDQPGVCADKMRACTQDVAQFCGCNGKTVVGSGSCPGIRYSARGGCTGS